MKSPKTWAKSEVTELRETADLPSCESNQSGSELTSLLALLPEVQRDTCFVRPLLSFWKHDVVRLGARGGRWVEVSSKAIHLTSSVCRPFQQLLLGHNDNRPLADIDQAS